MERDGLAVFATEPVSGEQERRRSAVVPVVALAIALLAGLGVLRVLVQGAPRADDGFSPSGEVAAEPTEIPGVDFLGTEPLGRHTHTRVIVEVDGEELTIPAGVGFDERGRVAELHTHDDSGVIHVESHDPEERFTLGQLLAVWGVDLPAEDALIRRDGRRVDGSLEDVELRGDVIEILIGGARA